jgi:hypothetical protein
MGRLLVVLGVTLLVTGCGVAHPDHGDGAADVTAAEGAGLGPLSEVPTGGAFGPWSFSHDGAATRAGSAR